MYVVFYIAHTVCVDVSLPGRVRDRRHTWCVSLIPGIWDISSLGRSCNVILLLFYLAACFCIHVSDFLKASVVKDFRQATHSNPKLSELLDLLPDILLNCRSINTRKSYLSNFNKWRKWCINMGIIDFFPAEEVHIALYFTSLIQEGVSSSVIESTFYSLKWFHDICGVKNPCESKTVSFLVDSAKRLCGVPVCKKKPITAEMISDLCDMFLTDSINLYFLRSLTFIVVGFSGFFRCSELISLKVSDLKFFDKYVEIFIKTSKTDQNNESNKVFIAKTAKYTCPVSILKVYVQKCGFTENEDGCLFRPLTFCKKDNQYRPKRFGSLSYTRCRELVREMISKLGLNPNDYGTHSLRRGGATASALNKVSDRLFKRHGRWKSESAKDGYVDESLQERLSVTANLGL